MRQMLRRSSVRIVLALALAPLFGGAAIPSARAQAEAPVYPYQDPSVRDAKVQQLREEFKERQNEMKERAERARKQRRARGRKADAPVGDDDRLPANLREGLSLPFGITRATIAPANTKANDKTADAAGAGQAEQSIAFLGQNGLCAWNDGQGFNLTPQDVQGYGYTTNGGATWTDGGIPPKTAAITTWSSDPVVALNEKTGDFYYCGLTTNPTSSNGVGVIRGTFSGPSFVWASPVMVASGTNATAGFDKQWMCADSSNGNLYVTYTKFVSGGDHIWFQRSTDNGLSWSAPLQISAASDFGYVQGSRPVVGPNGEVYVVYYAIGQVNEYDYMKIRKSTDGGLTFGAETIAANVLTNFGTGAPGFNRERGITMPGIAVDRSFGPSRGRVYVTYNETIDWYQDGLGSLGAKSEVENNGNFANATPFTIGQTIRGAQATTTDTDNWKFAATQGTTYVFWVDSLRSTLRYTVRIYCPNDTAVVARLAMGGNASTAGQQGFIVWTAPTTATYYFRWSPVAGTAAGYRIRTGFHTPYALDVARDQRDAMVVSSPDGIAWGAATRMNDDLPYYDNWLPEVAVACDGNVYGLWMDFRDYAASCFGGSNMYVTRSTNGGATWAANQVATTAGTPNWTQVASNIAPNQGDYNGMYGGDVLGLAFADGRLGDADVFTARVPAGFTLTDCPPSQSITPGVPVSGSVTLTNLNMMFGNSYHWVLTCDRAWPGFPASGNVAASAGGSTLIPIGISAPDTAMHNGVVHFCVNVDCGGGCVQTCCFDLTVNNIVTPALASLSSSTAEPGRVRLQWQLSASGTARVYRSEDAVAWDLLGDATVTGDGVVEFVDTGVRAGARYAYRLGLPSGGAEVFAGLGWVEIPALAQFAVHGAFPNPAKAGFAVSFSLPSNAAATLDVIDLAGRRVVSREVGALGAGRHTLSLQAETGRLPIGVYGIRLTQAGRVSNAKVSIVR